MIRGSAARFSEHGGVLSHAASTSTSMRDVEASSVRSSWPVQLPRPPPLPSPPPPLPPRPTPPPGPPPLEESSSTDLTWGPLCVRDGVVRDKAMRFRVGVLSVPSSLEPYRREPGRFGSELPSPEDSQRFADTAAFSLCFRLIVLCLHTARPVD